MTRDTDWPWNELLDYVDFCIQKHGASVVNRAAEILLGCRYSDEDDEFEWTSYPQEHRAVAEVVCRRHPLEALRRILRITEWLLNYPEDAESLGYSVKELDAISFGICAAIDETVPVIERVLPWLSFDQHLQLIQAYSPTLERFEGNFARRLIGVILCDTLGSRLEKETKIEHSAKNELREAIKALCKSALSDRCAEIREKAVFAGFYSEDELKVVLEQAMRDESEWVRSAAYWRMANLGEWSAAKLMEAAWDGQNIDVIAEVLVDIWGLQTLSRLYELYEEGDADLKDRVQQIVRYLQRIRGFNFSDVDAHQVAKQTKRAMRLMDISETDEYTS